MNSSSLEVTKRNSLYILALAVRSARSSDDSTSANRAIDALIVAVLADLPSGVISNAQNNADAALVNDHLGIWAPTPGTFNAFQQLFVDAVNAILIQFGWLSAGTVAISITTTTAVENAILGGLAVSLYKEFDGNVAWTPQSV